MRHLKNNKKDKNYKNRYIENTEPDNSIPKSLRTVLLLSWILPFIAVFVIYFSKMELPEKTQKITLKILNMNFTVILLQFILTSILQPLAYAKAPAPVIYALMSLVAGLSIYWIVSHIIATMRFLQNKDYSYKCSLEIFK